VVVQGFWVQGFRVQGFRVLGFKDHGPRFSPAVGKKTAGQIAKESLKKRITNIEVRYSIIIIFEKRLSAAIPDFIIRNFLFDILRFAVPTMRSFTRVRGSASTPAHKAAGLIRMPDSADGTVEIKIRQKGAGGYKRGDGVR